MSTGPRPPLGVAAVHSRRTAPALAWRRLAKLVGWLALGFGLGAGGGHALAHGGAADQVQSQAETQRQGQAPATAQPRVVTLTPHTTELVYAAGAGDQLVAVAAGSNYPPAAQTLPTLPTALRVAPETVLAWRPDVVVAWLPGQVEDLRAPLARLGIPLLALAPQRLDDIPAAIRTLGDQLGTRAPATAAADTLQARIDRLPGPPAAGADAPRVFLQVGDAPLFTVDDSHILADALRHCGAVNLFANLPTAAAPVSLEQILAARPDAIVLAMPDNGHDPAAVWTDHAALLPAARPERLIRLEGDAWFRPGPRLVDATEALCEALAPLRETASRP